MHRRGPETPRRYNIWTCQGKILYYERCCNNGAAMTAAMTAATRARGKGASRYFFELFPSISLWQYSPTILASILHFLSSLFFTAVYSVHTTWNANFLLHIHFRKRPFAHVFSWLNTVWRPDRQTCLGFLLVNHQSCSVEATMTSRYLTRRQSGKYSTAIWWSVV